MTNAAEGKVEYLIVDQEKLDIQIPYKPTHPYVTVYLIHSQIFINLSKTVTFMDDLEKKTTAVLTKVSLIYWYKQNKYKLNWFIKYDVTENFIRNFISMI